MELIWVPGGHLDVHVIPRPPVVGTETLLYRDENGNERPWFLVKTGEQLRDCAWPRDTMVIICREAVRERAWDPGWQDHVKHMEYVDRDRVQTFPAGLVTGSKRYRLMDISRGSRPRA